MANPGRRWWNSHDHRLAPSTGPSHRPHWAIFSANRTVFEVPSPTPDRRVRPNQNPMLVVLGLPAATSGLVATWPLPNTWKLYAYEAWAQSAPKSAWPVVTVGSEGLR